MSDDLIKNEEGMTPEILAALETEVSEEDEFMAMAFAHKGDVREALELTKEFAALDEDSAPEEFEALARKVTDKSRVKTLKKFSKF